MNYNDRKLTSSLWLISHYWNWVCEIPTMIKRIWFSVIHYKTNKRYKRLIKEDRDWTISPNGNITVDVGKFMKSQKFKEDLKKLRKLKEIIERQKEKE